MSTNIKTELLSVPQYVMPYVYKGETYHAWSNLSYYYYDMDMDDIVGWWKEEDGSIIMLIKLDEIGFKTKYEYLFKYIKKYNILINFGWDPEINVRQQIDNRLSKEYKDEDGNYIMMFLWLNYSEDQIEAQNPQFKKEVFVIDGISFTYYSFGVTSLDKKPVITNEVKTSIVGQTPKKGAMLYEAPKGSITRKNEKG